MITTKENDKNNNERKLVIKLWEILEGDKRNGIKFIDLNTIILSIVGNGNSQIKQQGSQNGSAQNSAKSFGKFINDIFCANPSESEELKKYFKKLHLTRLSKKIEPKSKNVPHYMYNPKVNESSEKMALKIREKWKQFTKPYISKNEGNVSKAQKQKELADLLVSLKKAQDLQKAEQKKNKQNEEIRNCTFKPKISQFQSKRQIIASKAKDKCVLLYNESKTARKKMDKTTEEIDFEKSKKELIFQPNASRHAVNKSYASISKKTIQNEKVPTLNKGYLESVERLKKAREEKELVDMAKNLGITLNRAKSLTKRSKTPEILGSTARLKKQVVYDSISSVLIKDCTDTEKSIF